MRNVPLQGARYLGRATRIWRGFPVLYIAVVFFVVPLLFLGLSALFEQHTKGWTVLGSFVTVMAGIALLYTGYWCRYKEGKEKLSTCFAARQRKRETMETLPDDIEYLKSQIIALREHTGLGDENDDAEAQEGNAVVVDKDDGQGSVDTDDVDEIET